MPQMISTPHFSNSRCKKKNDTVIVFTSHKHIQTCKPFLVTVMDYLANFFPIMPQNFAVGSDCFFYDY